MRSRCLATGSASVRHGFKLLQIRYFRGHAGVDMNRDIFEDLFVLEMANNHDGSVERGLKIIQDYGRIVRFNNIKAAMKFQLRDIDGFVHKDWCARKDIRYIFRTLETHLPDGDYATMVKACRQNGFLSMATPFDERSVDLCSKLGISMLKLASSDVNDWELIEKIATTRKPVIVSTGGTSQKDLDDLVTFFENRNIPLAINHCVSIYPTADEELELNQVDYLKNRYPDHVVGLSTHEYHDWASSMLIAYAKGARTFERHVDIPSDGRKISPYCSLPDQIDAWFKAYKKAKEMCGAPGSQKRVPAGKEVGYLDLLVRGVYAKHDLPEGHVIAKGDVYLAIPLQKGQISCRELMNGEVILKAVGKDSPILIDCIDSPYAQNDGLKKLIYGRGVDAGPAQVKKEG